MSTDNPPRATQPGPANNLPVPLTSFIGREQEIVEIRRLLATVRLLTLTGAGGCGKTRLAIHVAAGLLDACPDGVWFVDLAPLTDPALLAQTVASALGIHEGPGTDVSRSLERHLRPKSICLILDNCEHLVIAAASLAGELLRACPGLQILATSREPLGIGGETVWHVPSLSVPPQGGGSGISLPRLTEYEAIRLFIDRAQAALPGFTLTVDNAPALADLCRRLDGIPLAIELAAARVRAFSVEQIAARLDDRFRLLTAGERTAMPRQQTLQATVDWSYNLLSGPERALFRRLSVFAGGWTLEAVEAVAAGDGIESYAVLELLAQVVDKSLVLAQERRGAARYHMLETIRQYASAKLQEAGEETRTRDRHLACFLRLAEESEPRLRGPEDRVTLDRLEEEHDNLRAALDWSLTQPRTDEAALRLCGALGWFWWLRSYHDEGYRWLWRALDASPVRSAPRMKALHGAAWLAQHRRDLTTAQALLHESLDIARALNDRWMEAWVLHALARVAYYDNDPATTRSLGAESLAIAEGTGDSWLIAFALHVLGLAAYITADYETAWEYYARSLAIRREIGYQEGIGILFALMGLVALRQGDLSRAHSLFEQSIQVITTVYGPWGACMPLASIAYIAAASGQPIRAARLGAAAQALIETYHTPMIPLFEPLQAEALDIAGRALDTESLAAATAEGRAMSLDAVLAEAFAVGTARTGTAARAEPSPPEGNPFPDLTAAERQVLRLLTTGRTTREIAAELVIAVSTVDRHLTHIYGKLGVRNRAEAVTLAIQHHLVQH